LQIGIKMPEVRLSREWREDARLVKECRAGEERAF